MRLNKLPGRIAGTEVTPTRLNDEPADGAQTAVAAPAAVAAPQIVQPAPAAPAPAPALPLASVAAQPQVATVKADPPKPPESFDAAFSHRTRQRQASSDPSEKTLISFRAHRNIRLLMDYMLDQEEIRNGARPNIGDHYQAALASYLKMRYQQLGLDPNEALRQKGVAGQG